MLIANFTIKMSCVKYKSSYGYKIEPTYDAERDFYKMLYFGKNV